MKTGRALSAEKASNSLRERCWIEILISEITPEPDHAKQSIQENLRFHSDSTDSSGFREYKYVPMYGSVPGSPSRENASRNGCVTIGVPTDDRKAIQCVFVVPILSPLVLGKTCNHTAVLLYSCQETQQSLPHRLQPPIGTKVDAQTPKCRLQARRTCNMESVNCGVHCVPFL